MQFASPAEGTLQLAQWMLGPAREKLFSRFPEGRLTLVMDLTLMTNRDPAVRRFLIEGTKPFQSRIARAIWIPPRTATAVYRASLKVAASLVGMFGVRVEIHSSISFVVRAYRLSATAD
jgi:hypothetical protein